jgi:hypothetical protein
MDTTEATRGSFYAPQPLRKRVWRWLGFKHACADRPEEDEEAEGWAPSWFIVETWVHLDWKDRIRILLSGKLHVEQAVKTDVPISRSRSTSAVGVLSPSTKFGER